MNSQSQSPTASVFQLVAGFGIFQAMYVAAKFALPDHLSAGPKAVEDIAREAKLHPQSLYRLLRALASVGVFAEVTHGTFRNTALSETFMTNASGSLRPFLILAGDPEFWRSWGELRHSIQTGSPAFEHVYGMPFFDYLTSNPEMARVFDDAMASRSAAEITAMSGAYDFSDTKRVIDIGGGNGALLNAIVNAFPHLEGVLFDLPHVIERAQSSNGIELSPRIRFAGGDFFGEIPEGGDVYLLKKIIHDWPDDRAREILRRCRHAMSPQSRLLLIELIVPPGNDATFTKFLDLWMMVGPGGRERTEDEYRDLLNAAGLSLIKVIPTRSPISVIEAVLA